MQKSVKEHIQNYWINEVSDLVRNHAFMSFGIISVGIEFLGKCLDYYTPQSKCPNIEKNLLNASQITENADVKNDMDAAKSKIDAYNKGAISVSSTTSSSEALTNNKICDLFEKNIGNVSKAYFDNSENTGLGEAIKNMQSAQNKFESTNDMHPTKLDLYAELRCGMAHVGLPGKHLHLTSDTGKTISPVKNAKGQITLGS